MTEQQWFESTDLLEMLRLPQITNRQRRLFAVACCRHIQHLITDPRSLNAVDVVERFIDDKATKKELETAYYAADAASSAAYYAAYATADAADAASSAAYYAAYYAAYAAYYAASSAANATADATHATTSTSERQWQLATFRHITGNPFQPKPVITVSETISKLAHALYNQENCHFAIHDALLDANLPDLADHFKDKYHPKGCHILDLLCTR